MRQVFGGDAFALVGHRHSDMAILSFANLDRDWRSGAAIFQRIVDQIAHELFDLLSIAADAKLWFAADPKPLGPIAAGGITRGTFDDRRKLDHFGWLVMLFGFDPR